MRKYDKNHCWQYEMKVSTLEEDKELLGFSQDVIDSLRVDDFDFELASREEYAETRDFIVRYEWLGNMPPYPTHYFTARYRGELGAVLVFTMPNAFSKLMGDKTKDMERLLARGASASWTPKNLASAFISYATDWMGKNTQYKIFTAYSDPMAKELGTVYQASNWIYIGQASGAPKKYKEPGSNKWVSDRKFRNLASYKRYAKSFGYDWKDNWSVRRTVLWENMPEGLEERLREEGRRKLAECEVMEVPPKHKYVKIQGKDKRETRDLLREFYERNPQFKGREYPTERGGWNL